MRIRPATTYQKRAAEHAEQLLRDALVCARAAQCPRLIRRIQLAVTSAGGAVRHVNHRVSRTDRLGRPLRWDGKPYGKTTITAEDRAAFANVESPKRPEWFRAGQYA